MDGERVWIVRGYYGAEPPEGVEKKALAHESRAYGDDGLHEALLPLERNPDIERITATLC